MYDFLSPKQMGMGTCISCTKLLLVIYIKYQKTRSISEYQVDHYSYYNENKSGREIT